MPDKPQILIVDDDQQIAELLQDFLQQHGFRTQIARHAIEMKKRFERHHFDLVVLDVMLPGQDGLSLCQYIRQQSDMPIIMLSAAGSETDRVVGLEMGADDYLTKPFGPRELLARIKALLRRAQGELGHRKRLSPLQKLSFANWTIDREKHCLITEDNLVVALSTAEYNLLSAFIEHPRRILTRDQLSDLLYGREATPTDRAIDVLVGRLRRKIEQDAKKPKLIVTVRGGGYQLMTDVKKG